MSFIASVFDSLLYCKPRFTRCSTFQCPCGAIRCELRVPPSSYKLFEQTTALYRQTDLVNFCKACPNGDFVLQSDDATHLVSYYKSDIHIFKGHDKIKAVKVDNKTSVIRLYCDSCGTPLGYEVMSSPITMLHSKLISSGPIFIPTHIIGSAATKDDEEEETGNKKTWENTITTINLSSPISSLPLSFSGGQQQRQQQSPRQQRRRRGPAYYVGIRQLSSSSIWNFSFFSWKSFGRIVLGYLFQKHSYGGMCDPRYYSIIPIGYDKIQIHTNDESSANSMTSNITSSARSISSKRSCYDQAVQNKLEELEEEENELLDMILKMQSKVQTSSSSTLIEQ